MSDDDSGGGEEPTLLHEPVGHAQRKLKRQRPVAVPGVSPPPRPEALFSCIQTAMNTGPSPLHGGVSIGGGRAAASPAPDE